MKTEIVPKRRRFLKIIAGLGGGLALSGIFGNKAFAVPSFKGAVSDHFDSEKFFNPFQGADQERGFLDVLKWQFDRKTPKGYWPEFIDDVKQTVPEQRVLKGEIRATFINHATVLLQVDGLNIITDPVFSERVSPVSFAGPKRHRATGVAFKDLPPIDLILLSHNHYDHCDIDILKELQARDNPVIFTALANKAFLNREGFKKVKEFDWWQGDAFKNIRVTAVPAQHFSGRSLGDRNYALWCGFMVETSVGNIYFAADTGYCPVFKEIGERFKNIRLALIPIGAYKPEWFMGPVHVSPVDAVKIHHDVGAQESIAIHFGTFNMADEGEGEAERDLLKELQKPDNSGVKFLALKNGESHSVKI
ncbi:MAG: MBL fold metallo-hydrolase [Bacteroidota bacterium]